VKNFEWAKRAIFSFSNAPLKQLFAVGAVLSVLSALMGIVVVLMRIFSPETAPRGVATMLLTMLFFGSVNLLAIGIVGEYVAKIMEEVKQRPRLIRNSLIRNGVISQLLPDPARALDRETTV
jgi:polyisoprenyl-phosphate glycosyltransferase